MTDKKLPPEPKPKDSRMVKIDVNKVINRGIKQKLMDKKDE